MFNGLFNKSGKHSAAVFVDYEHWYYGYNNIFSMKPNVEEWYEELTEEYSVKNIVFFGDFHGNSIEKELPRLEKITKNVVHTASTKDGVDKDFTDFIMLDHIYQTAMAYRDNIDVFILFTGDAHFNSAASFLKNICKKEVGIYGIRGGFSNQLKTTASWWVEYPNDVERYKPYFQLIFDNLNDLEKSDRRRKALPTFIKTVETVSRKYNVSRESVRAAMQWLVDNGYLIRKTENSFGKSIITITANWHRVVTDGLWTPAVDRSLTASHKRKPGKRG